jgi:hypothetical protein
VRRFLRFAFWSGLIALLLLAATAFVLYRGTQHVPEFYQQALAPTVSPQQQFEVGDDFEREVLELHNSATKPGRWEAEFTAEQINAWLASVLPRNHPQALPVEVREPRVKLTAQSAQLAWRLQTERFETVISLQADVYLTDQPNQIAVRLHAVRAGWVPIPLSQILERVSEAARRGGVDLSWSQQDGDPVALLRVPTRHPEFEDREFSLEQIELADGRLRLAGQTTRGPGGGMRP